MDQIIIFLIKSKTYLIFLKNQNNIILIKLN